MKCPLRGLDWQGRPWGVKAQAMDCLKEECAWWDSVVKRCVVQNISEKMSFIYLELTMIRGKPPEREES